MNFVIAEHIKTVKCKGKFFLRHIKYHATKTYKGVEAQLQALLAFALDGFELSASRPGHFTRERDPGTNCIGSLVGLQKPVCIC